MDDRIVFFDLETGGLDPRRHPLIQFAGVAYDRAWQELETLAVLIQFDEADAEPEALKLNSYDRARWARHAITADEARKCIGGFLARHATVRKVSKAGNAYSVARLAGHNVASFDCPFLLEWFKAAGVFLPAAIYEALDTLHLARWAWWCIDHKPPENFKLATLCGALRIPHEEAHDALSDVRATAELARRITAAAWGKT